jgi:hypothetical protein
VKQAFLIRSQLAAERLDRNVAALLNSVLALARLSWAAGKPDGADATSPATDRISAPRHEAFMARRIRPE